MSSKAESHYWNVDVEAEERQGLFIQFRILTSAREAVMLTDIIPNVDVWEWLTMRSQIQNEAWQLVACRMNSPQNVKNLYLFKFILSTSGQGPHVVTAGGPLTPLSSLNHQEQLKGMQCCFFCVVFFSGCSHTSWEDNTPLRKFTYLFFHGTFW